MNEDNSDVAPIGEGTRRTMSNDELLEKAKEAISKLFGDMSVSPNTTRENLNELIDDIEIMLDALRSNGAA